MTAILPGPAYRIARRENRTLQDPWHEDRAVDESWLAIVECPD
jgi:hypothetical protein